MKKVTVFGMLVYSSQSAKPKLTTLGLLSPRGVVELVGGYCSLVDSRASHSFVAAKLVEKYQMTIILGTSMVLTLPDGSQVTMPETCSIPIIIYTIINKPVYCMILFFFSCMIYLFFF